MTHRLVYCRVFVSCDHKQSTGPECSECGGSDFKFIHCLVKLKRPIKKIPYKHRNSRQITLFDD
ncbi:hypothetical protein ES708_14266 [subsurface metagenome]